MSDPGFLDFTVDFNDPATVSAYDEMPLWSALFGQLLLEEVPLRGAAHVLDAGCGTGFPLIELAERLGPASRVVGVDPWSRALERARQKIAVRGVRNVELLEGSASALPFDDGAFDLIVSNLGVNNFDDAAAALRECTRVLRRNGIVALTTNLQGHMHELYAALETVLAQRHDRAALGRLSTHVGHRATVSSLTGFLVAAGLEITRVVERTTNMRFLNGTALFNHYFIKLGFLGGWKEVAGDDAAAVFSDVIAALDESAENAGELRLTIPMAYVEARKP